MRTETGDASVPATTECLREVSASWVDSYRPYDGVVKMADAPTCGDENVDTSSAAAPECPGTVGPSDETGYTGSGDLSYSTELHGARRHPTGRYIDGAGHVELVA